MKSRSSIQKERSGILQIKYTVQETDEFELLHIQSAGMKLLKVYKYDSRSS